MVGKDVEISHLGVLSGSAHRFDVALLWKFTSHDDFALTVSVPLVLV